MNTKPIRLSQAATCPETQGHFTTPMVGAMQHGAVDDAVACWSSARPDFVSHNGRGHHHTRAVAREATPGESLEELEMELICQMLKLVPMVN